MAFTTKQYAIEAEETYSSLANKIINDTTDINESEHSESLSNDVAVGLKKQLQNKKLVQGNTVSLVDNAKFYLNAVSTATASNLKKTNTTNSGINELTTTGPHLYFSVKEFKDYKDYAWKHKEFEDLDEKIASGFKTEAIKGKEYEFATIAQDNTRYHNAAKLNIKQNLYELEIRHGKIGSGVKRINGDKSTAKICTDGYLYVFDVENKLKNSFIISDKSYQEVQLSESDCSYRKKIGNPSVCAKITNFFKDDVNAECKKYQFVFSKVALSKNRLFPTSDTEIIKDFTPADSCRKIPISRYGLAGLNDDTRSGANILSDYQNKSNTLLPNSETYHLSSTIYKNIGAGVVLHVPDPIEELKRRTKIFRSRMKARTSWINEEYRMQQYFLHQSISAMIKKDSAMASFANRERMDEWNRQYQRGLKIVNDSMLFGVGNLVAWLESPELSQCLFNHLMSEKEDDLLVAIEVYGEALIDLDKTIAGDFFYQRELNRNGFLCILLNINESRNPRENYLKKAINLVLNDTYFNADVGSEATAFGRKVEQAILGAATASAPAIMKILGNKAFVKLAGKISTYYTSIPVPQILVQPLSNIKEKVMIFDTSKIPVKKMTQGLVGFFEVINVVYAVKAYTSDSEHKNRNMAGIIGAGADLITENHLLFNSLAKRALSNPLYARLTGTIKIIAPLQFISGVIDCCMGIDSAFEAYRKGEIGMCIGYSFFAYGGYVVAAGAAVVVSGIGSSSTIIGLAPGVFVMLAGVIIQGVGYLINLYWDNREIKNWIESSIFGNDAKILDNLLFKDKNTEKQRVIALFDKDEKDKIMPKTSLEIREMNTILTKFSVDVSFNQLDSVGTTQTGVYFEIEPRLLTPDAVLTFSDITIYMKNRLSEKMGWDNDGNRKEKQMRVNDFVLDLSKEAYDLGPYVERDANKRIVKLKKDVFYKEDVDRITGNITLDLRKNSLQKLTLAFDEEAEIYE